LDWCKLVSDTPAKLRAHWPGYTKLININASCYTLPDSIVVIISTIANVGAIFTYSILSHYCALNPGRKKSTATLSHDAQVADWRAQMTQGERIVDCQS
jgi:hypothetical protein